MLKPDFSTAPHGKWKFSHSFSGHLSGPFYSSFQLQRDVEAHRLANGISCHMGWHHAFWSEACIQNGWNCSDDTTVHEDELVTQIGRALWVELHRYADIYPEDPSDEHKQLASTWITHWISRIPSFSRCSCQSDFVRWHSAFPVQLDSRASFQKWSEIMHDRVNQKLQRKLLNEYNRNHHVFSV
jgi:Mitochondrial sulfhydryl oxidase involved in the biogenesis of cytosolic Fe/S proteins